MEKIHGTSAHLKYSEEVGLTFFSGGEKHDRFVNLFDSLGLPEKLRGVVSDAPIIIYGEAYGGKQQGMSATYGAELKFIAFDVRIGEAWLEVPNAEDVCLKTAIEFVHYEKIPTDLASIDAQRDADSVQAIRNGVGPGKIREGVVLRPLTELTKKNGARIIAKHKRDEFMETSTPRKVNLAKLAIEADANKIALDWVTEQRLAHVLDKMPDANDIKDTKRILAAMVEDVLREAEGEIEVNNTVRAKINARTAQLWRQHLYAKLAAGAD